MPDSPTDPPTPSPTPTRLPGVGSSLDLRDQDGHRLSVVRRNDGSVMLYPETPTSCVDIDAATAGSLGAFVSGHYRMDPAATERMADVLGGLVIDWIRIQRGWAAVGRSIEELEVRRRTGVTIVAILRGSQPIIPPDPVEELAAGDELVVAAREEARAPGRVRADLPPLLPRRGVLPRRPDQRRATPPGVRRDLPPPQHRRGRRHRLRHRLGVEGGARHRRGHRHLLVGDRHEGAG